MVFPYLPDDMLLFIAKHFLSERDHLALAIAGASENFTTLYGINRTSLVFRGCYFLTGGPCMVLLARHISPLPITTLDVSHCYWLPAMSLVHCITKMVNLEELAVQDTQISLTQHLPQIFLHCKKIVKLGFSLKEQNLDKFQEDEDLGDDTNTALLCVKECFSRLTHLKIYGFALNTPDRFSKTWLIILEVLKWCRCCANLFIKIAHSPFDYKLHSIIGPFDVNTLREMVRAKNKLYEIAFNKISPQLCWVKAIKSLVLYSAKEDGFIGRLLFWLMNEQSGRDESGKDGVLERLWITDQYAVGKISNGVIDTFSHYSKCVKSHVFNSNNDLNWNETSNAIQVLRDERFRHIEHVAGISFHRLDFLPDVKYITGHCEINDLELNEFCKLHPKLEYLHFRTYDLVYGEEIHDITEFFGDGDWKLPSLKRLVYQCWLPSQKIIDHIIKACPNIEELHIYCQSYSAEPFDGISNTSLEMQWHLLFYTIQFKHLTWLSISGINIGDGSYLPLIIEKCAKLERLHLRIQDGKMKKYIPHFEVCLPAAASLRDFRLHFDHIGELNLSTLLRLFQALLKCASHLERVVLRLGNKCSCHPFTLGLEIDPLVSFVNQMERLICFCLTGFHVPSSLTEMVKEKLTKEILPQRPALWFHVGQDIPEEVDLSIPRAHYDEIINPIDPFFAPPPF